MKEQLSMTSEINNPADQYSELGLKEMKDKDKEEKFVTKQEINKIWELKGFQFNASEREELKGMIQTLQQYADVAFSNTSTSLQEDGIARRREKVEKIYNRVIGKNIGEYFNLSDSVLPKYDFADPKEFEQFICLLRALVASDKISQLDELDEQMKEMISGHKD